VLHKRTSVQLDGQTKKKAYVVVNRLSCSLAVLFTALEKVNVLFSTLIKIFAGYVIIYVNLK